MQQTTCMHTSKLCWLENCSTTSSCNMLHHGAHLVAGSVLLQASRQRHTSRHAKQGLIAPQVVPIIRIPIMQQKMMSHAECRRRCRNMCLHWRWQLCLIPNVCMHHDVSSSSDAFTAACQCKHALHNIYCCCE